MLITIDEEDDQPIYKQIADEIRLLIARDELKEDSCLPSVRQLAADLGINLNTVAMAYRELQSDGLITVRHGFGSTVASRTRSAEQGEKLRKPLRSALADLILAGLSWAEVMKLVVDEMGGLRERT